MWTEIKERQYNNEWSENEKQKWSSSGFLLGTVYLMFLTGEMVCTVNTSVLAIGLL